LKVGLLENWNLRDYQLPLWDYLRGGGKRAVPVWHRRAGKDEVFFAHTALSMLERPGGYWHMLPMANQARTAIWEAVNPHTGIRRVDEFFPDALFKKRETDMMIHCKVNASTWQVKGSDNYGAGVGSPPVGVVFSEYSQADPMAWAYISPILVENGGWAGFPSTPRGHNHLERMLQVARGEPGWFGEVLTTDDTHVIGNEALLEDLRQKQIEHGEVEGKALWMQEWHCSFNAAIPGAYYGDAIEQAEKDGRIGVVPYEPSLPVIAAFDLGHADATAIWFAQNVGMQLRVIDYYEMSGVSDLGHYAQVLRERGYRYASPRAIILPHDAAQERLGQAKSVAAQFEAFGYLGKVLPQTDVEPGIRAGRQLLQKAYIDSAKCARGLDCLRNYHRRRDDVRKAYIDAPVHDWSSHGADAWRYLAIGWEPSVRPEMQYAREQNRASARQRAMQPRDPWSLSTR
jgi:hypothetical protein